MDLAPDLTWGEECITLSVKKASCLICQVVVAAMHDERCGVRGP